MFFALLSAPLTRSFDRILLDGRHRGVVLTAQEAVLDASDVQFDSRWGMLSVSAEARADDLLALPARLKALTPPADVLAGKPGAGKGAGPQPLATKAQRQKQIEAVMASSRGGQLRLRVDATPGASDVMAY